VAQRISGRDISRSALRSWDKRLFPRMRCFVSGHSFRRRPALRNWNKRHFLECLALYRGTTSPAAKKLALSEGYGLQAAHNCCVMTPALAAEGRVFLEIALCPQPLQSGRQGLKGNWALTHVCARARNACPRTIPSQKAQGLKPDFVGSLQPD
jgi:hypothetical protein